MLSANSHKSINFKSLILTNAFLAKKKSFASNDSTPNALQSYSVTPMQAIL